MLVEDIAAVIRDMMGMPLNMPRPAISRPGTLVCVFAVSAATVMRSSRGTQGGARITRLAAEAGLEAEAGEAVTGIRTLDIPGSAITAWGTGIRMAAITVTGPVGAMIRITDIVPADTILTNTDTGPIRA